MQKAIYEHFLEQAKTTKAAGITKAEKDAIINTIVSMATSEYWTATGIHFRDWMEVCKILNS